MVNIAELLKYAPKGTKLYSPLFGEVKLVGIDKRSGYPIDVIDCNGNGKSFTEFGVYFANHPDAECLLFPSKEHRTWEGWSLPVENEFKVGDWVVRKDGETFYGGNYAEQITLIEVDEKGKCIWLSSTSWVNDDDIRLWTINDAKDGDVLAADECYVIFKEIEWLSIKCYCTYHYMGFNPMFYIDTLQNKTAFKPANKEQCDLLFKCIKENGYTWDADKKELRRIINPKFKVGGWVVYNNGASVWQVNEIDRNMPIPRYELTNNDGDKLSVPFTSEYNLKEWTIQDAKDGDVLVTEDYIFIFKYILHGGVHLYCHYNIDDEDFDSDIPDAIIGNIHDKGAHFQPATKEQRDLLFQKMEEDGYEWDAEKKELRKIKPHYGISNFNPFDKVLIRVDNNSKWTCDFFSYYHNGCFHCVGTDDWSQCIPFNDDTKHLLRTTDMCDEQYINW